MRIGVMGRILRYEGFGASTLLSGLINGFELNNAKHEIIIFTDEKKQINLKSDTSGIQEVQISAPIQTFLQRFWWDHVLVGKFCRKLSIDVLYAPAHIRPIYSPCPVVVSVFDMMYHKFPIDWPIRDRLYFPFMINNFTVRADAIAALSENTRSDIIEYLNYPNEKINVIYPGVPEGFQPLSLELCIQVQPKYELIKPFILYIGGFHPRKNVKKLVAAFESIADRCEHDLVITGKMFWKDNNLEKQILESPVRNRIRLLGMVPREDLPRLLNLADIFVFPSYYEGFGFPVLEAMACGCPSSVSNRSAIPEVGRNAVDYFSPESSTQIANSINKILGDYDLRLTLRQKGIVQASKFSWLKMAKQTLNIIESVA
jgi:glycosyltransferase involved in cell wall biosynthesis